MTANPTISVAGETRAKKSPRPIKVGELVRPPSAIGWDLKRPHAWKTGNLKEIKLPLFTDNIIENLENSKVCTNKLLELISEFSKVTGHKTKIISNSLYQCQTTRK